MAHVQKFTKAAAGHMCAHYDRSASKISNENINLEKTKNNYNLASKRNMSQMDFINQRCSEIKCLNRKDVNVMCSWIITMPTILPATDELKFFQSVYDFLENRYGKDNIISANVHVDEIQPHMHFAFVPVVVDKKKGIEKLSAKERVNRTDLQTFHRDLEEHMAKVFGYEIGILNEATKEGNRSIEELKKQSASDRLREVKEIVKRNITLSNQKLKEAEQEAAKITFKASDDIKHLNSDLRGLRAEYEAKKAYLKTFTKQDSIFNGVIEKKSITGKIKGYELTPDIWEKTTVTYMDMIATEKMKTAIEDSIEKYKNSTSHEQVVKMRSILDNQIKDLKKENKQLQKNNQEMQKDINRVLKVFKANPQIQKAFYETEEQITQQEKQQSNNLDMER